MAMLTVLVAIIALILLTSAAVMRHVLAVVGGLAAAGLLVIMMLPASKPDGIGLSEAHTACLARLGLADASPQAVSDTVQSADASGTLRRATITVLKPPYGPSDRTSVTCDVRISDRVERLETARASDSRR